MGVGTQCIVTICVAKQSDDMFPTKDQLEVMGPFEVVNNLLCSLPVSCAIAIEEPA